MSSRTPRNAIIGFCEILQERLFGELNENSRVLHRIIYIGASSVGE